MPPVGKVNDVPGLGASAPEITEFFKMGKWQLLASERYGMTLSDYPFLSKPEWDTGKIDIRNLVTLVNKYSYNDLGIVKGPDGRGETSPVANSTHEWWCYFEENIYDRLKERKGPKAFFMKVTMVLWTLRDFVPAWFETIETHNKEYVWDEVKMNWKREGSGEGVGPGNEPDERREGFLLGAYKNSDLEVVTSADLDTLRKGNHVVVDKVATNALPSENFLPKRIDISWDWEFRPAVKMNILEVRIYEPERDRNPTWNTETVVISSGMGVEHVLYGYYMIPVHTRKTNVLCLDKAIVGHIFAHHSLVAHLVNRVMLLSEVVIPQGNTKRKKIGVGFYGTLLDFHRPLQESLPSIHRDIAEEYRMKTGTRKGKRAREDNSEGRTNEGTGHGRTKKAAAAAESKKKEPKKAKKSEGADNAKKKAGKDPPGESGGAKRAAGDSEGGTDRESRGAAGRSAKEKKKTQRSQRELGQRHQEGEAQHQGRGGGRRKQVQHQEGEQRRQVIRRNERRRVMRRNERRRVIRRNETPGENRVTQKRTYSVTIFTRFWGYCDQQRKNKLRRDIKEGHWRPTPTSNRKIGKRRQRKVSGGQQMRVTLS